MRSFDLSNEFRIAQRTKTNALFLDNNSIQIFNTEMIWTAKENAPLSTTKAATSSSHILKECLKI